MSQLVFILGRQPELSKAELTAVFPTARFSDIGRETLLAENLEAGAIDLRQLGGTIKVGEVFAESARFDPETAAKFLAEQFSETGGKITFGVSCYSSRKDSLKTLLIGIKKSLKEKGLASRFANKDFTNLTSAQVELNGLTKKGTEILITTDGKKWWYAATIAVQPFAEYSKRDYEKPVRDARVGMLPPKLAQILINLAVGSPKEKLQTTIYDPFCGTGTILVEAGLLGYQFAGSDISPEMVEAAQRNLAALNLKGEVHTHDAIRPNLKLSSLANELKIVTEGYLGPPMSNIPDPTTREKIFTKIAELYGHFFRWTEAKTVVLTLPVYCERGVPRFFSSGKVAPIIERAGWEKSPLAQARLVYVRPNQTVGREVTVWRRKGEGSR